MASPLADIDWNNLDSAEMTTVVKLLLKATQERYNIGRLNFNGAYFNNPGDPHQYTFPSQDSTAVEFELNDGDPLQDWTTEVEDLISGCLRFYVDTEKTDDQIGATEAGSPDIKILSDVADAPLTYDNRLFEITGYTSYPDLSVYAAEEVKKWYDMISAMKVVWRLYVSVSGVSINDNFRIWKGEFDKDFSKFFVVDEDGAEYYGGQTEGEGGEPTSNTTPYTDFKAGNDNLFDSGDFTFTEGTDIGTPPIWYQPYNLHVGRLAGGNYWNWMRSARLTIVADWTDVENNLGVTGRPVDYDESIDKIRTFSEDFPTGLDPNTGTPAAEDVIYRRSIESVTVNVNEIEIEIDDQVTPGTLPTNITDLAADEEIRIGVDIENSARGRFYENWDGDGGFIYFTPP
tara:strand:- start:93 stop:1295 length:1203 start_codon:yes stop_codon:yes gene_type:complete